MTCGCKRLNPSDPAKGKKLLWLWKSGREELCQFGDVCMLGG